MKKAKEGHYIGYKIFARIPLRVFQLLFRPKIINKNVIPKKGPVILCGNHQHMFDQNWAMISTKRQVHYIAKIEYFQVWWKAWFFRATGCIPVNRSIKDENAIESALEVLNNGWILGLFPEGTRNKTDAFLLPFKFGAVSMAQKTGATIVPFAVTGETKILKRNHLNVKFGEPFKVPKSEDLQKANEKLYNSISNLKKEGLEDIKNGKY